MSYPLSSLSELASIYSGFAFKSKDLVKNGIPVIKIANIQNKRVFKECVDCLPKYLFVPKLEKYLLKKDDVLIAMTGAGSVGKVGKMRNVDRNYLVNQRVAIVRPYSNKSVPEFIYQVLSLDYYEKKLYGLGLGAGQPNVSAEMIGSLEIPFPDFYTQQKIASILSAYDDLIENNIRRVKILEEMAQTIYNEWFVKFRFPGHENVKIVESELGMIPEGWEVVKLSEICNIVMGQSPKSEFYNEVGEGLPFHQGVTNFGDRYPTDSIYCTKLQRIAESGDILFSVRAPVGRINVADKKIIIGRGLCAIRNNSNYQNFTFHQLRDKFKEEDSMGGGTIFKAVTKSDMHGINLIYPSASIIEYFETIISSLSSQIQNLTYKNSNLIHTRDLLLPRLIAGELDVSELDIDVGGITA